ncbi:MAG: cytochrome-c peroxidase [Flavobacteriaceae bacterium CG_4_8_14_3_um_filter_34_10]|nr:cytochrome-c peroxidase [Flavobacteriia bacterium]OIP50991.1 MAG: cytochrome-c peroxidase [Flavobacteriaceae bacterium CG2_30_34_30]PIQ18723.1 MAG: cytochrome-c peroxidase [Flavobacteriaceae bacterium CG18_big_fil_WC_8_21_14_2_50_34_36]PIV48726.1 MAG: cytochrome-c peroxidase [Flavobacteriaceae bacterium CG02_land_8_20_14_3_00_34_13]PIX08813.1 MAG: cytochrome-c peroxidase [Flavobacteriaceae bacterium CG_4_8_14_3_um_filter_34_10]PIZ07683.1 MAG: cytochrome-c peroxidase [Flavobacteriaceae bacte
MNTRFSLYGFLLLLSISSCSTSENTDEIFAATPLDLEIPQLFQDRILPPITSPTNPQSVEGVALGRKLFFDPILSGNGTQACASCHNPQNAFSDEQRFSVGIDGSIGTRNSMPLHNLAWNYNQKFFWDGRAVTLEEQIFAPVTNPIEMNNTWPNAVASLQSQSTYPELFRDAFGTTTIDSVLVSKAIAQFLRTLISANSRFDRHLMGENILTPQELNGIEVFMNESKGDCFHCHGNPFNPLWTDNTFHNNGLDETFADLGLGNVTGDPRDNGRFKAPSLRNLAYTAPYMHDGRFATLDEVINHYSEGLVFSETIDPLMKTVAQGGVHISESDKADLKAFLLSLSDESFINNSNFQDPN